MSRTSKWTHESIRHLPGDDPIAAVVQLARELTLQAMEEGWSGPPFDPVWLAESRGIAVVPREDIRDARTVPAPSGDLTIEFNPNRPRGRIRYSIAHELAHTFFPDCADRIRHRADKEEMSSDEWQLEMLCNIAAAELIMPLGSFPDLRDSEVSIDKLMDIRREYDVSTEALLLRFIRLTQHPCALFAASRIEAGEYAGRYRIDYGIASATCTHAIPVGAHLRHGSVASECVAVGFTAQGREAWPASDSVFDVQCVGVTPYPGSTSPRVLGLAMLHDERAAHTNRIVYVAGDATEPRGEPPHMIVHVMNDRSSQWGGGFAKSMAIKFADAQVDFRRWAKESGNQELGSTHFYGHADRLEVATMIAQKGFGPSDSPRISYPALERCLRAVAERALQNCASVHMPRIGCGQAGGKWEIVEELLETVLISAGVRVTVYDYVRRTPVRRR